MRQALLALVLGGMSVAGHAAYSTGPITNDPEGYPMGWAAAFAVNDPATGEKLFMPLMGHNHVPDSNNSMRAYNPSSDQWTIWQQDNSQAISREEWYNEDSDPSLTQHQRTYGSGRNNYMGFYLPWEGSAGQLWLTAPGNTAGNHGVWDFGQKQWVHLVPNSNREDFLPATYASEGARNFSGEWNLAHASCPDLETLVAYGGKNDGLLYIVERSSAGVEPYIVRRFEGQPPGPRNYARRLGLCAGEYFYIFGGKKTYSGPEERETWRVHVPSRTWERLADAPVPVKSAATVTYDSTADSAVVFQGLQTNQVLVYDMNNDSWREITSEVNMPVGDRTAGAYIPGTGHLYRGGEWNRGGVSSHSQIYCLTINSTDDCPGPKNDSSDVVLDEPEDVTASPEPESSRPAPPTLVRVSFDSNDSSGSTDQSGSDDSTTSPGTPTPPSGGIDQVSGGYRVFGSRHEFPGRDKGPCPVDCKHGRLTEDPTSGKMYWLGGDYGGSGYGASGRQELYSFDPTDLTWTLESPYCAPSGMMNFRGPDQVGWVWDSRRNQFWALPGLQYGGDDCQGMSVTDRVMAFDPQTATWSVPAGQNSVNTLRSSPKAAKFAVYDRQTDKVYMLAGYGSGQVLMWDPETAQWSETQQIVDGYYVGQYSERVGRRIYTVSAPSDYAPESVKNSLIYWDIDTWQSEVVAELPFRARSEFSHIVHLEDINALLILAFSGDSPSLTLYRLQDGTIVDLTGSLPLALLRSRHIEYLSNSGKVFVGGHNNPDSDRNNFWLLDIEQVQ